MPKPARGAGGGRYKLLRAPAEPFSFNGAMEFGKIKAVGERLDSNCVDLTRNPVEAELPATDKDACEVAADHEDDFAAGITVTRALERTHKDKVVPVKADAVSMNVE